MRTLLGRVRAELSGGDDEVAPALAWRTMRVSRAPGRLDVMGGIADYTGSLVCEATLDMACAVAVARRPDRQVQVFSFNLLDEHRPFTLRMPLEALADQPADALQREFDQPGRKWAAYVAGCLFVLHEAGLVDLRQPNTGGLDIALYSTVPMGAGLASSAAVEVATMVNLVDHFGIKRDTQGRQIDPMRLAALCQMAENRIVGAPCGIMDQVTSCAGREGQLLMLLCQPHELRGFLALPPGIEVIGIDSGVRHSVGAGQYGRTRCAAFMGHRIILSRMEEMGHAAGMKLAGDPMRGYLANLELSDYKRHFREFLPQLMRGSDFIARYGSTIDPATQVQPDVDYPIGPATDHHVHEAQRVRNFVQFLEEANSLPAGTTQRGRALDKAGHLMYASHVSYTRDAMLGAAECDLLVELVRRHERTGLYGAKITGGGEGGTVAVLANDNQRARGGIAAVVAEYERQTGRKAQVFQGSSAGAWETGSAVVNGEI